MAYNSSSTREPLAIAMSKCMHLSTEINVSGSYCESDVIAVFSKLQNIVSRYASWLDGLLKAFQLPSAYFPNLDAEQLLDFMKVFVDLTSLFSSCRWICGQHQ